MLVELLQRAYDTFLPDEHEERPFLSKVVRRLGEGAARLCCEGQLGALAAAAPACHMPVRVRVSNAS